MQSELRELREKIEQLQAIGIEYVQCKICDAPFAKVADMEWHKRNNHIS